MTLMQWTPFREALSLRQAIDRLMEDAILQPGRGAGGEGGTERGLSMPLDVKEHEDELVVRASLPGVKPDDVDLSLEENVLTIQGEFCDDEDEGAPRGQQAQADERPRGQQPANGQRGEGERREAERRGRGGPARYHQRERVCGRFFRQVRLPIPVDPERVNASFEHGVLTITLAKAEQAKRRRIEVKRQGGRQQLTGGARPDQGKTEQPQRDRGEAQQARR